MKRTFTISFFVLSFYFLLFYSCSNEDVNTDSFLESSGLKSTTDYYPYLPEVYRVIPTARGIAISIYYAPGAVIDTIYYRKYGNSKWSYFSTITSGSQYSGVGLNVNPATDYPLPRYELIHNHRREYGNITHLMDSWEEYEFMTVAKYPEGTYPRNVTSNPYRFIFKPEGTPPTQNAPAFVKVTLRVDNKSTLFCLKKNYTIELEERRGAMKYRTPFAMHVPHYNSSTVSTTFYSIPHNTYGYINIYDGNSSSIPVKSVSFDDTRISRLADISIVAKENLNEAVFSCPMHPRN